MNEKGFVTISLILFLPLALIVSFGTLLVLWLINQKHSLENICYEHVLDSQNTLIESNNELLKLNPLALSLIHKKRILNKIILFAPPQAKAAAKAQKAIIIAQQNSLNLKQNSIVQFSNLKSQASMTKVIKKLKLKIRQIESFWNQPKSSKPLFNALWVPSQIKIQTRDIASTYNRSVNHSRLQTHRIDWSIRLKNILPKWLLYIVPISTMWTGHCSSHPAQKGYQWYPMIGQVRL